MKTSSRFQPRRIMSMALGCLLGLMFTATAANVNADAVRRNVNEQRLEKMHPWMVPKTRAVISDLESHGYKPIIDVGVWRSPALQAEKVKKGYSKTNSSFHTNTVKGKPASYAADIVDVRWGWFGPIEITKASDRSNALKPYWLKLAASAESHRCVTGIYWDLSDRDRARMRLAIATREWEYRGKFGWDTAHTQPHYFTYSEARSGKLPR